MPVVNSQQERRQHGGTNKASTAAGPPYIWRSTTKTGLVVELVGMTPEEFVRATHQDLIDMGAVPVEEER